MKHLSMHVSVAGVAATGMLAFAAPAVAAPVTIDFESTLPTYFFLSTYQESGFTVTSDVPAGTLIDINNVVRSNLGSPGTGTNSQSLFWGDTSGNGTITLVQDDGLRFDLLAFDASSLGNPAGNLTIVGTLSGGGTINQVIGLNSSISTYNVTGMNNLVQLQFVLDGLTYYPPYDLDNIQLNVVPIPAAVWLFASALGWLGWSRRRRAQT